jgi:SAM-dependent methyltransferase
MRTRALAEIQRVLKPGGHVFFSVPAYQFLFSNNDRVAHHFRRYTKRRLTDAVCRNGFQPVKVSYFNLLLFPLILPTVLLQKFQGALHRPQGSRAHQSLRAAPAADQRSPRPHHVERTENPPSRGLPHGAQPDRTLPAPVELGFAPGVENRQSAPGVETALLRRNAAPKRILIWK